MELTPKDFSKKYETPLKDTIKAFDSLKSNQTIVLGVSGKIGAGKDTVAPLIMQSIEASNPVQDFFARPLKQEIQYFINLISQSNDFSEIVRIIASHMKAPEAQVKIIVQNLWDDIKKNKITSPSHRTEAMRFAMQYWGTEVRRNQDYDYWVKKTMLPTITALANQKSVFITDPRFENEIDSLEALGAFTLRLKVSSQVQIERIEKRDRITPSFDTLNHISEISLNNYEAQGKFSLIIDTDKYSVDEIVAKANSKILGK